MTDEDRLTVGIVNLIKSIQFEKMDNLFICTTEAEQPKAAFVFAKGTNTNSIQEVIPMSIHSTTIF